MSQPLEEKISRDFRLKRLDNGHIQVYAKRRSRQLACIGIKHSAWRLAFELSPGMITHLSNFLNAPASPAVIALFKAAWEMSVEQQAGPEGWSMAKRWAFDNLAAALEPFRTAYGDELDYSKIPVLPTIEKGKSRE